MLELVGLQPTEAKRRLGDYSLGMRQRLGIAHALLGDPDVLILDEPANGLDPAGIRWMRGLLRGFADQGGTVLLSSHLLHEVEVIADELIVIGRGRIVAQGTKESLLRSSAVFVRGLDDAALTDALDRSRHRLHPGAGRRAAERPPRGRHRSRRRGGVRRAHRAQSGRRRRPRGDVPVADGGRRP